MQTNSSSFQQPRLPQEGDDGHGQSLNFNNNNNNNNKNSELEFFSIPSLSSKQSKSSPHLFKLQPLHTPRPTPYQSSAATIGSLLHHINDHNKWTRTPTSNNVVYLGYSSAENDEGVDSLAMPRLEEDEANETRQSLPLLRQLL